MAIIDESSAAYNENSCTSWNDTLQNSKIILYEYDKAILALSKTDGIKSYTLNTGQGSQTVTRQDLNMLLETRQLLLSQIYDLELFLGVRSGVKQVIPLW